MSCLSVRCELPVCEFFHSSASERAWRDASAYSDVRLSLSHSLVTINVLAVKSTMMVVMKGAALNLAASMEEQAKPMTEMSWPDVWTPMTLRNHMLAWTSQAQQTARTTQRRRSQTGGAACEGRGRVSGEAPLCMLQPLARSPAIALKQ